MTAQRNDIEMCYQLLSFRFPLLLCKYLLDLASVKVHLPVCPPPSWSYAVVLPSKQPLWHMNNILLSSLQTVNHNWLSQCARFLRLQFAPSKNICRHASQTAVILRHLFLLLYFFWLLFSCTSDLVILAKIVHFWSLNESQARVNGAASCRGVALHVAGVQIAASTKGPSLEMKWIPPFTSASAHHVLEDRTFATVAQKLSKHAPHICQPVCTFGGSAQCDM